MNKFWGPKNKKRPPLLVPHYCKFGRFYSKLDADHLGKINAKQNYKYGSRETGHLVRTNFLILDIRGEAI